MFHLPPDLSTRAASSRAQSKSKSNYKSKTQAPLSVSLLAPSLSVALLSFAYKVEHSSISILSRLLPFSSCFLIKTSGVAQSERPRWLISFYNKRTSCVLSILFDIARRGSNGQRDRERKRVFVASLWPMIDSNDSGFLLTCFGCGLL